MSQRTKWSSNDKVDSHKKIDSHKVVALSDFANIRIFTVDFFLTVFAGRQQTNRDDTRMNACGKVIERGHQLYEESAFADSSIIILKVTSKRR